MGKICEGSGAPGQSQRIEVQPPFGIGRKTIRSSGRPRVRISTWRANTVCSLFGGLGRELGLGGVPHRGSSRRSVKGRLRASTLGRSVYVPQARSPGLTQAKILSFNWPNFAPLSRPESVEVAGLSKDEYKWSTSSTLQADEGAGPPRRRVPAPGRAPVARPRRRFRQKRDEPLHRDSAAPRLLRPQARSARGRDESARLRGVAMGRRLPHRAS